MSGALTAARDEVQEPRKVSLGVSKLVPWESGLYPSLSLFAR